MIYKILKFVQLCTWKKIKKKIYRAECCTLFDIHMWMYFSPRILQKLTQLCTR